jgi:hypothetical protein
MAAATKPGPICEVDPSPKTLPDGTLCRCKGALPGVIGEEPEVNDHFVWGVDASKPLNEEVWFEKRYPGLLEESRLTFVDGVDTWVCSNWGQSEFKDQKQRINIAARDTSYLNQDKTVRDVKKNDDRFAKCGDIPQTAIEADQVLGSFSIDIETPVTITYSTRTVGGKTLQCFEWTTNMYVEDVLGLQADNQVVHKLGKWTLRAAPSRKAKRAIWKISGEGMSYVVVKGDSLSKIAAALTGDPKKWKELHDANRATIPNPDLITPGQRIIIPAGMVSTPRTP